VIRVSTTTAQVQALTSWDGRSRRGREGRGVMLPTCALAVGGRGDDVRDAVTDCHAAAATPCNRPLHSCDSGN
jgi:hypothetical protein